jgi:hypothetical protein
MTATSRLQEDPYKLVVLSKDFQGTRVVSADFLVHDATVGFIVTDMNGIVRLFMFDPEGAQFLPFILRDSLVRS